MTNLINGIYFDGYAPSDGEDCKLCGAEYGDACSTDCPAHQDEYEAFFGSADK